MVDFIGYDENGDIRYVASYAEENFPTEMPGLNLLVGKGDYWSNYVLNGQIVSYTEEQKQLKSLTKRRKDLRFSNDSMSLVDLNGNIVTNI